MPGPSVLDNTPWWLPDVSVSGAAGLIVDRCTAYGDPVRGPRHLEGGFYDLRSLGPHVWICKARADGTYTMRCEHGHKGQPQKLCNGHVMMIRKRASGVCPACAHPPAELQIQESMQRLRDDPRLYAGTMDERNRAAARNLAALWDLQQALDELVERGIVHRCPLSLREVS